MADSISSSRSSATAYGWWLVGGGLGLHRFYVGHEKVGYAILATMVAATALGLLANVVDNAIWPFWLIGAPYVAIVLVDLFLIPFYVKRANQLREENIQLDDAFGEVTQ